MSRIAETILQESSQRTGNEVDGEQRVSVVENAGTCSRVFPFDGHKGGEERIECLARWIGDGEGRGLGLDGGRKRREPRCFLDDRAWLENRKRYKL